MSKLLPFFTDKEVPYTVAARPDTGLYSAKLGIWLFLASEVMLFGGLFSAYIFLRLGAEPGYWPTGLLNVPVGTINTAVLIGSSVTVVFAWAALKMREFLKYKLYMAITILCGLFFLCVKLTYEWPAKFEHFGVFIKQSAAHKYVEFLGDNSKGDREPRWEISGHLMHAPKDSPYRQQAEHNASKHAGHGTEHGQAAHAGDDDYVIQVDAVNAKPDAEENGKPSFWPRPISEKSAVIHKEDVESASAFLPRHSTYFATYFLITGLHGLHVLGGILVFAYLWLPFKGGALLYKSNPEHLANRVEVAGLFWHFVDLVWIFVFPIFYLL
ncbi:MAG: heme-copper oxidase subunit III [Verrucomicrobiota bacterium]